MLASQSETDYHKSINQKKASHDGSILVGLILILNRSHRGKSSLSLVSLRANGWNEASSLSLCLSLWCLFLKDFQFREDQLVECAPTDLRLEFLTLNNNKMEKEKYF